MYIFNRLHVIYCLVFDRFYKLKFVPDNIIGKNMHKDAFRRKEKMLYSPTIFKSLVACVSAFLVKFLYTYRFSFLHDRSSKQIFFFLPKPCSKQDRCVGKGPMLPKYVCVLNRVRIHFSHGRRSNVSCQITYTLITCLMSLDGPILGFFRLYPIQNICEKC